MLNIAHHSRDLARNRRAQAASTSLDFDSSTADSLSDGILAGPKLPRHGLTDDHDIRRALTVVRSKLAAFSQRNSNRSKIPWTDTHIAGALHFTGKPRRASFDGECPVLVPIAHREISGCRGRHYAGYGLNFLDDLRKLGGYLLIVRVILLFSDDVHCEQIRGREACAGSFERVEASKHKTRAN